VKRAGILGLGLWVPEAIRRNDAWPASFTESFGQHRERRRAADFTDIELHSGERPYEELYARHASPHEGDPFKGAIERRVGSPDVPTAHADGWAATRAMEDGNIDPRDVSVVMSSALVPDRLVPSNGPAIQHLTGCVNAVGLAVDSVCSSALAQLDLASALVESGRAKLVLCVQSHQISRINDMTLPCSPMFGDASAAFVVGEVPEGRGLLHLVRAGDGSLAGAVTFTYKHTPGAAWWRDAEGPLHPGSEDLMGAHRIGRHLLAYAIDSITSLCRAADLPLDAAAAIATIQPTAWYQPALADGLGVCSERIPSTHATLAHLGSAAVVANLLEARRRRMLRPGAPVILFAHGAGVTRYAALLRW
jgi:3-oxoacyl-[acyl-carrier-protein] synthase III